LAGGVSASLQDASLIHLQVEQVQGPQPRLQRMGALLPKHHQTRSQVQRRAGLSSMELNALSLFKTTAHPKSAYSRGWCSVGSLAP